MIERVSLASSLPGSPSTGASLARPLPEGATREADAALPVIDVPGLPGARTAARLGYRSGAITLRAACLAAPANGWAPGVEEIVLGRATQLAREALGGEVTRFDVGAATAVGPRFEQRFEGSLRRDGEALGVSGRHWLGFAGDPREAIACTLVCTEPASGRACEALVSTAAAEGAWLEAPPPGVVASALLLSAQRPYEAAGVIAVASIAVAAIVIALRPRPRA